MTSMPRPWRAAGMDEVDKWSGGLTPEQKARMEEALGALEQERRALRGQRRRARRARAAGLVAVDVRDVVGETKKNPTVAFYAAGFGVMFLLFSAAGAGGALIEEAESGTLDRILSTRVSMTTLLLGKLVYLAGVGVVQLTLMFVWGALVFGIELASHLPGFLIMTVATAIASSTFGLMLASVCRSRMQLVAHLEPRDPAHVGARRQHVPPLPDAREDAEVRPDDAQRLGASTASRRSSGATSRSGRFWPQVAVLIGVGVVFFLIARKMAERWEAA